MQDRPSQRDYWSGKAGEEWAAHAERMDVTLRPMTDAAVSLAAVELGERALDIGCGAGSTTLEIARLVGAKGSVLGLDLSPQMLEVARARAANANLAVQFLEADAGSASLGAPFDIAFSRFGVMFFEAPIDAFAHIRAGMRADGRLVFLCWRPLAENPWGTLPIAAIAPMLKTPLPAPDPDAPGPYAFADGDKVRRILKEAGWRDVVVAPWDGDVLLGGGGSLSEIADFVLKIGPCARAIADQNLDIVEAKHRLMERFAPLHGKDGVLLPAACWLVSARA